MQNQQCGGIVSLLGEESESWVYGAVQRRACQILAVRERQHGQGSLSHDGTQLGMKELLIS